MDLRHEILSNHRAVINSDNTDPVKFKTALNCSISQVNLCGCTSSQNSNGVFWRIHHPRSKITDCNNSKNVRGTARWMRRVRLLTYQRITLREITTYAVFTCTQRAVIYGVVIVNRNLESNQSKWLHYKPSHFRVLNQSKVAQIHCVFQQRILWESLDSPQFK